MHAKFFFFGDDALCIMHEHCPCVNSELMTKMSTIASFIRTNTTQLNFGGGIKGVIVKETDPEDVHDVFFGYESLNDNINVCFYVTFRHVQWYIHRKKT